MPTINMPQAKDGSKTYRVRVRVKGQLVQTASFPTLKDARKWTTMSEGEILAGRHSPTRKLKHTLGAARPPDAARRLPAVGKIARDAKGLQQRFDFQKDRVLPSSKPIG
jgi:hypothetical protein